MYILIKSVKYWNILDQGEKSYDIAFLDPWCVSCITTKSLDCDTGLTGT